MKSLEVSELMRVAQADLEDLVLSGNLFNSSRSGSSSPRRSPSPDAAKWPNDEYADKYSDDDGSPNRLSSSAKSNPPGVQGNGVGVGVPGRTGVKGVIRDRNEAERGARDKRAAEMKELNKRMEKASLTGLSYLEEKGLKQDDGELEELSFALVRDQGRTSHGRSGRFGHLREVGLDGFLKAIEAEERHVWVVLHLYHPVRFSHGCYPATLNPRLQSLDRCEALDNTMGKLAREHATVKFLRAKASAVGFASGSSSTGPKRTLSQNLTHKRPTVLEEDEEDPYGDPEYDEKGFEDAVDHDDEDDVDTDVLPTMLVYRGGDLVYNWVRVDWEAGDAGVEELLLK